MKGKITELTFFDVKYYCVERHGGRVTYGCFTKKEDAIQRYKYVFGEDWED